VNNAVIKAVPVAFGNRILACDGDARKRTDFETSKPDVTNDIGFFVAFDKLEHALRNAGR
jgi:hypothetical protein